MKQMSKSEKIKIANTCTENTGNSRSRTAKADTNKHKVKCQTKDVPPNVSGRNSYVTMGTMRRKCVRR